VSLTKLSIDELGIAKYSSENIMEMLYKGQANLLSGVLADPNDFEIVKFNEIAKEENLTPLNLYAPLDISQQEFDNICQNEWFMPDEYKQFDIISWLINQVIPESEEYYRIIAELDAFEKHNMFDMLKWLKYFVDTCRANNVVWGVGRGSSVSSYILFLIGVHKINSIQYNLDWRDFLR
jgi:DNA polymerase III alpha subunit